MVLLLVIASLSVASAGENDMVTISGTVYLPDGTTPANATEVAVMNVRTEELDNTHTDEDGRYSLSVPALQDDTLKFAATRGFEYDEHTVEVSEVSSPYDITLGLQKPGTSPTPVQPPEIRINETKPMKITPKELGYDPDEIEVEKAEPAEYPSVKDVQEATNNGTDVIDIPHYNVTVSNLLIKDGVAVYNQREWVQIYLKNVGDIKAFKVTVDVSVIEEGQVRSLKYLHFGALQPDKEKERKVRWTPQVKEDCTIVLDVEYMENHPVKGNEVNYTEEIGVAVADEEPGTPETSSPWLINGPVKLNGGVLELSEDIIITSTGHLKMVNGAELILQSNKNGKYTITVEDGGRFDIWGKSELKSSTSWNNFRFHNYGRLDVNRSKVKWTYGNNKTLSDPGGIQCFSTSSTTIRNSTITEGWTHNIYAEDTSPSITNSNVTFAGSAPEGGYGLYATGNSQPEIMHSNISDNKAHGVHFENIQNPVSPPWPPETIQASSYSFPVIGYTNITDTPVGIYVKDSDLVGIGYGNITLGHFGVYVENSDVYFLDANITKMNGDQLNGYGCIASDSSIFLNSTEISYNNWGVAVDNSEVTIENNSRILANYIFIGHGDGISGGTKGLGVSVDQLSTLEIKNSLLGGSLNNVVVRGGSTASIHDNTIGDITITPEGMQPYHTRCIVANDSEIDVSDNEFYGSHRQILLNGITSSSVIENNYFDELRFPTGEPHRSFYGIELIDSYPRIIWNEISNYSTVGVYCHDNSNPEISNNTIYSYGGYNFGIYIDQSSPVIEHNELKQNEFGIYAKDSTFDVGKIPGVIPTGSGFTDSIFAPPYYPPNRDGNELRNNFVGIYLDNSITSVVDNSIYANIYGIFSDNSELTVYENNIRMSLSLDGPIGWGIYGENNPTFLIGANYFQRDYRAVITEKCNGEIAYNRFIYGVGVTPEGYDVDYVGVTCANSTLDIYNNKFEGMRGAGVSARWTTDTVRIYENIFKGSETHYTETGVYVNNSYPEIYENEMLNGCKFGVYSVKGSTPDIWENLFRYNLVGVIVENSSPSITKNQIEEIILTGAGIDVYEDSEPLIQDNNITLSTNLGIFVENSRPTIIDNNISFCEGSGVYSLNSYHSLEQNNIYNNSHGIYLENSEVEVTLNDIYNNSEWGLSSITTKLNAHDNIIHNNTHGIYSEDSPGTAAEQIADNTIGGQINVTAGFILLDGYGLPYIEATGYGVYLKNSPLSVTGNHIIYNAYGVVCNNSDASVDSNQIEKHLYGTEIYDPSSGSFVTVATGFGVYVFEELNPTITNNQIDTNHRGIVFDSIIGSDSVNEITGNSFTSGETLGTTTPVDPFIGIQLISSSYINIVKNEINNHSATITVEDSSHVTVEWNDIDHGGTGLSVRNSDFITVQFNNIDRFGRYGIYLSRSTPSITWNNVTNNGVGIFCYDIPATPNIYENNIFGNTQYGLENQASNPKVDAQYNWWGHSTGPHHSTNYPSGQGDDVSDNVNADNWKTSIVVWW